MCAKWNWVPWLCYSKFYAKDEPRHPHQIIATIFRPTASNAQCNVGGWNKPVAGLDCTYLFVFPCLEKSKGFWAFIGTFFVWQSKIDLYHSTGVHLEKPYKIEQNLFSGKKV